MFYASRDARRSALPGHGRRARLVRSVRQQTRLARRHAPMLALLGASTSSVEPAECLPGDEWARCSQHELANHKHLARSTSVRVVLEEAMCRRLPINSGETKAAPRGQARCALAVHAVRSDGSAAGPGEAPVVIHQIISEGMRFGSDLRLGDVIPLVSPVGTSYSFEAQPGYRDVVLLKMPQLAEESDELYEKLKKPKDEV